MLASGVLQSDSVICTFITLTTNRLLSTTSLTNSSQLAHILYVVHILYCILAIRGAKEKIMLLRNPKEEIYSQHCSFRFCKFISSVYKVNHLSDLHQYIQNTVNVIHITSIRHLKWEDNMKKKFIFICRYRDSGNENAEAAIWLFSGCCSVTQSRLTLCEPMDCSTPGFPVLHHLLELAQTLVHWVCDAIQPFHPLSSPSPPVFNLSQHQDLF